MSQYMPPELWLNRPYGPPADLWALGCLLYELMTYTVPFDGSSVADLKAKVTSGQFRPIVPGRYSQELIGLMSGLLSLNPARRPGLIAIFSMPQAQERLAALPPGQLSLLPPAIMKTIQVTLCCIICFLILKDEIFERSNFTYWTACCRACPILPAYLTHDD